MTLTSRTDEIRRQHVAVSVLGSILTVMMFVGSLGPWVRTPVISFSGWAGIGFPLAVIALVALVFAVMHGVSPRRGWLIANMLLAAFTLLCVAFLAVLKTLASQSTNLAALVFARGDRDDLFEPGQSITFGWGLILLGVASLLLMVVSTIGMFGRFDRTLLGGFRDRVHRRRAQPGEVRELGPPPPRLPGSDGDFPT